MSVSWGTDDPQREDVESRETTAPDRRGVGDALASAFPTAWTLEPPLAIVSRPKNSASE